MVALVAAFAPAALADEVYISNGDRLSGEVLRVVDKMLALKSDYAGEVNIKWSAVERLESAALLHVTISTGVLAGEVSLRDGYVEVRRPGAAAIQIPRDDVLAIRSSEEQETYVASLQPAPRPGLLDNWFGSADLGFSAARGNADTSTLSANLNATRTTERDRAGFYYTQLFGRESTTGTTVTTANIVRGGLRYDRLVTLRLFVFGFGDFEFDELQQVDLRSIYGGGLGIALKRTPRTRFDLFGGASYNKEVFAVDLTRRTGSMLAGQEFSHKLNGKLTFNERLISYFNMTDTGEYRVTFDSSLGGKLNSWLGWHFTLSDRYNSNPAVGAKNNDLLLTTGLRFTFGTTREFTVDSRAPDLIKRR